MVRYLILLFSVSLSCSFAQTAAELDKRNGFKDIQVNTSVLDYEGLEFKKDDEHAYYKNIKVYVPKKDHYESIGSIKIHDLEVLTYKDSIFQITVITDKDPNLYKGLKSAFGEPEYNYRSKYHHWTGENLRLSYVPYQKDKLELTYTSFLMREKLKEDKEEVIEDIVSDF
ncbi:hypothetical protein [Fulvivirga lutea]|uniref:Uncharacterized protein n=1 Tax=Fulvivirga lutea TaxID=2810512 RepID=A0A975A203_9BACT|nr:hypothetical protein [Fulvivirga lutea]QSE98022.1 hypothetical protein JR347_02775 [Fulvivirga lutea]